MDGVIESEATKPPNCDGTPISVAALVPSQRSPQRPTTGITEEFIIKNETDLEIPRYFLPDGEEFSVYARKLARAWGRILLTLHRIFDDEADFAIGFVFDTEAEAQFEEGQYGTVYYVNPVMVVEQWTSASRSFRKRFKLTERDRLISIAAHEFVHGGCGYEYHDESFAGKQTDVMAVVMKHRRRFNWCFQ